MSHGFEIFCEGKPGDGCGGGRLFYIENERLFAYDPAAKSSIELAAGIKEAYDISKSGCRLFIRTRNGERVFDLSLLRFV